MISNEVGLRIHNTDLGNARRLVRRFREDIRYCERLGGWFLWDGSVWAKDDVHAIEACAKEIPGEILQEAGETEGKDEREALARWALRTESGSHLREMVRLARSEPDVVAFPEEFDAKPWLLNVENGVVDLKSGDLLDHDRRYLLTKLAPVTYDPDATAPTWERFLGEILKPGVADYLKRAVGLSLIGEVLEHVLFFQYGTGANGKTTFLKTVQSLLGDYAKQGDSELLLSKRGDTHPTGVADLVGSRFVVTTEVEDGRRLAEALVKMLTGGDRIKARFMHRDFFEFDATWTIWMAANHKPVVRGTDEGIWRRVRLIPFEVTIPPEDQDPELVRKLEAELPGILNWAIEGCLEYQQNGLQEPAEVLAATSAYRMESDTFGAFLQEETEKDSELWVESSALYKRFVAWCDESGERSTSQRVFGERLRERGFEKGKHPENRRVIYVGLCLAGSSPKGSERVQTLFSKNPPREENTVTKVSEGFGANDSGGFEGFGVSENETVEPDWRREEQLAFQEETA